jgi:hypothetical protein
MLFQTLAVSLFLVSSGIFAQNRSPAVEDFVGIEMEHKQVAPQGTESLYNLEQDLNKIQDQRPVTKISSAPKVLPTSGWSLTHYMTAGFILGLPAMIWFMMMNHLKRKASVESASNIEVLEKYRKDREKKVSKDIRKAS